MDLTPYLEALRRDLAASAAPGGPEIGRAAALLATSLDASARLALLEALSDAAAEITDRLGEASVEVRLRGREADFVISEAAHEPPVQAAPAPTTVTPPDVSGDVSRITLRLPEPLKEAVERAAAAEGISVNAWLVRAVGYAVAGPPGPPPPPPPPGMPPGAPGSIRLGRRITGYAQA